MFNNRGVIKFADTPERIDHSNDTTISVSLGKVKATAVKELMTDKVVDATNGRFSAHVPAGDFRVFEIVE